MLRRQRLIDWLIDQIYVGLKSQVAWYYRRLAFWFFGVSISGFSIFGHLIFGLLVFRPFDFRPFEVLPSRHTVTVVVFGYWSCDSRVTRLVSRFFIHRVTNERQPTSDPRAKSGWPGSHSKIISKYGLCFIFRCGDKTFDLPVLFIATV